MNYNRLVRLRCDK